MLSRRLGTVLGVLLADARRHAGQTAATLGGVATGVAVIVGIHLASAAALQEFRGTFEALGGRATHQLSGVGPLPAERLVELLHDPSVADVHPVCAATLMAPPRDEGAPPRALRLVGVDPLLAGPFLDLDRDAVAAAADGRLFERLMTEAGTVAAAPSTLAALGVADGVPLVLRAPRGPVQVTPLALPDERLALSDPPVLLADIATAQELLGLGTDVLRYDLVLEGEPPALEPGERLERPEQRGERAATLTRAFRLNLLCLGFLAVLVGAFLAFNMAQFATTRRRPLLGRLRCLGCPARHLLAATLLEAALLGLLGGIVGLLAGRLLAEALVGEVATTMRILYGPVGSASPDLDGLTALLAIGVAVVATVAATLGPARDAALTPPGLVAGRRAPDRLPSLRVAAVLALAAGLLLLPRSSAVLLPEASVLALLLAVACALPHLLGRLVRRPVHWTLGGLAAGRLGATLGRTGVAAGALAMPLAMTIAVIVMVGSLRQEVIRWSGSVLAADIYVRPLGLELAPDTVRLGDELLATLESHPDVRAVDLLRVHEEVAGERSFQVAGARHQTIRERDSLRILAGGSADELVARMDRGEVLVSEPLARRESLEVGDRLALATRQGPLELPVAGIFQDFALDRGVALLAEERFLELYGDPGVRGAALLLQADVEADALRDDLAAAFPDTEFRTVAKLRTGVMEAFDQTFAVTWVLATISTALALVGILTAVLCLHLERRDELGILRALGARLVTVGKLLLLEALVLVAVAALAAVPTGMVLAWILVAVINTRSFGWSFPLGVPTSTIAVLLLAAVAASLLAALVPWLMVRRSSVAGLLEPGT